MASIVLVAKALYFYEETEIEGGMMNLFALPPEESKFNELPPKN